MRWITSVFAVLAMCLSSAVWAQGPKGPRREGEKPPRRSEKPAPVQPKPRETQGPSDEEIRRYAYEMGRNRAHFWIQRHGWCQAYLSSMNAGMHDALVQQMSDGRIREDGRRSGAADSNAERAFNRAAGLAQSTAQNLAMRTITERFESIVDTNRTPNLDPTPPQSDFQGFANGYNDVYGEPPTLRSLMREHPYTEFANVNSYDLWECQFDTWDMYNRYPRDPWDDEPWRDWDRDNWAFQRWANQDSWYGGLPVAQRSVAQSGFKSGYIEELYYDRDNELRWWRLRGQFDGREYGLYLGGEYSRTQGFVEGFNATYLSKSMQGYGETYSKTYSSVFDEKKNLYLNNAVLSVRIVDLSEEGGDGIVEPGEALNVKIAIVNSGRKRAKLEYSLSGTLLTEIQKYHDVVEASSTFRGQSELEQAARVVSTVRPGAQLSVQLVVNGIESEDVYRKVQFPVGMAALQLHDFVSERAEGFVKTSLENRSNGAGRTTFKLDLKLLARHKEGGVQVLDSTPFTEVALGQVYPSELRLHASQRLSPLALLRGEYTFWLVLENAGSVIYERQIKIAPTMDDGLRYLIELVRQGKAEGPDFQPTAQIIVDQLANEWRTVTAQKENFYEDDAKRKKGPAKTVAGRISELYQQQKAQISSLEPFVRLRGAVLTIADTDPRVKDKRKFQKAFHSLMDSLGN